MPVRQDAGTIFGQIMSAPQLARANALGRLIAASSTGSPTKSVSQRIAIGVGAAAVGLALRFALEGLLGTRVAYVTFYPVFTVAAIWGGSVSGLVAALLCAGVAHLWLFPLAVTGDWVGLSIFLTSAAIISGVSEMMHGALSRADYAEERAADKDRLQIANERLRLAMSAGAIGAWDFDAGADKFEANSQMLKISGLSPDTQLNLDALFAIVAPEDRSAAKEGFLAALDPEGDGRYFAEYRIRRANDGAVRWIGSQAQAFFTEGKSARLIGVSRDITHQKEVEGLLLEKAQLADQMVKVAASVPGVICSFRRSPDGKDSLPYVSGHFPDVFGLLPEDVKDDVGPLFQRIHADDIDSVIASIDASVRTRTPWRGTFRYDHPDKGWIWIEGQSAPVFEPSGAILWHGYVTDVTARQRAEEELREGEAHLRAFYDSGLLGVIYWNADGVIAEANDGFLEMLGYSREDLDRGRINWIKITPPEFLARDQAALEGIRANGSTKRPYETEYLRKNGERIPVLMAGSALDAGATKGVAFVLDISDRKRAEARLQTLYINQFDVMRNMAARFAHEITQPLTAAGAYSAAARRMLDPDPTQHPAGVGEILEKATREIRRAGQIISRLREFISHGDPNMLQTNLHDLIRQALAESGVSADGRVKIQLQLNAARDGVLVDKVQLVLVLVNLIRNAREAMSTSPSVEFMIETSCDDEQIQVDIIDKGRGISPELLENLFEPFQTASSGGMGIGLSVSRAIIEAHHGRIWAEAGPGCGTVVSLSLPLFDGGAEA